MGLLSFFKRNKKQDAEISGTHSPSQSFYSFLYQNGWHNLSAYQALQYYQQVAPLFTAIDIIAQEVTAIPPLMYDKAKKKFIHQHPVLDLLAKPNTDSTYSEFIYKFVAFYLLTGNNYTIATGEINRPPLELYLAYPQTVAINPHSDGYVESYAINGITFNRADEKSRFRFINDGGRELYQSKTFNPMAATGCLYGMSKLTPIYYEIEQYIQASIHNLSMLEKGATPSLVLTSESPAGLTDDQYQRLQEQMDLFYAGASNSGRAMILEGGFKTDRATMTNRDMDYARLKENITFTIYNALRIPLPKVSPDNMTLANMETAKLDLYDNAVIPVITSIFQELTNFLMPRYKGAENLQISFDEGDIVALEPRRNEQVKLLNSLGVMSTNEIRRRVREKDILNGDYVYHASSLTPINVEPEDKPEPANDPASDDTADQEDDIKILLARQRDKDGNPLFTDSEIKEMSKHVRKYA